MATDTTGLQLFSTVRPEGAVELALSSVKIAEPSADEVLVRIEAAPVNPSDLRVMFAGADVSQLRAGGSAELPSLSAPLSPAAMRAAAARVGLAMPLGIEGAGVVVRAGSGLAAQALVGRKVALTGVATYAEYGLAKVGQCQPLPENVSTRQGAAWFVNPMTALCMLETMRQENHGAMVHTAAGSSLGHMVLRLCQAEKVPLVNVVRRPEVAAALSSLGAQHVCDSSRPDFREQLVEAISQAQATLAFDAVGGGTLASDVLEAMELAASRRQPGFRRYGTAVHKQVYIYGSLDDGPTKLSRAYGMAFGVGGWVLPNVLAKLEPHRVAALRATAVGGLTTTFASTFAQEVSLRQLLAVDEVRRYAKVSTGLKYLVLPAVAA